MWATRHFVIKHEHLQTLPCVSTRRMTKFRATCDTGILKAYIAELMTADTTTKGKKMKLKNVHFCLIFKIVMYPHIGFSTSVIKCFRTNTQILINTLICAHHWTLSYTKRRLALSANKGQQDVLAVLINCSSFYVFIQKSIYNMFILYLRSDQSSPSAFICPDVILMYS